MPTTPRVVLPLRILLVLAFLALLVTQAVALPRLAGYMAEEAPALAYLRWPLLTVSVLELVCAQVVIVCTWRLLGLVEADRIFSDGSIAWVDAILAAIAAGWVLLLGLFGYVVATWGDPGLPALIALALLAGGVLGLLVVVVRTLLRQATTLRTDMEAVI